MAQTFNIPNTPLPVGETVFGPFNVNAGVQNLELHFNPRLQLNSNGNALAEIKLFFSQDGGASFLPYQPSTGLFGDPAYVNSKTGSTTDAVSRFNPIPTPSQLTVKVQAAIAFTLTGASLVVN